MTERLTRASPREIAYAFQVEDAVNYTQTWRAEMTLNALDSQIYEYACHEGNYALTGILAAPGRKRPGFRSDRRSGRLLLRHHPAAHPRLQHRQRQAAAGQDDVVEAAVVELRTQGRAGLVAQPRIRISPTL